MLLIPFLDFDCTLHSATDMISFKVVMLGRLTWLECRLWLAVAGITRFYPDHDGDDCDDEDDSDDCGDCGDCNLKDFFPRQHPAWPPRLPGPCIRPVVAVHPNILIMIMRMRINITTLMIIMIIL